MPSSATHTPLTKGGDLSENFSNGTERSFKHTHTHTLHTESFGQSGELPLTLSNQSNSRDIVTIMPRQQVRGAINLLLTSQAGKSEYQE